MLGRLPSVDERDRNYLIATIVAEPVRTYRYWWTGGLWADQGNTGTCVGHAWAHYVEDGPVTWPGAINPINIYCEACKLDVWPANDDCDLNFGTSVRAGAKHLQSEGRISSYLWAWDLPTVVTALLTVGPVVVGSNWYSSMFNPDTDGFLRILGSVAGGHAYLLNGVNSKDEKVRIKNSWGRGWGNNGHAWLSFDDLARLLSEGGEACLAVEGPV